jgi:phosphinothricin acetyltransferase
MNKMSDKSKTVIRLATVEDAPKLLEIYRYYVESTAITYEYDVPSLEEFEKRIENVLKNFPYLVAEQDGTILGYAYASKFHERAAYQWSVEMSIYLDKDQKRNGLGRMLYEELEKRLKDQGILNLYACIGYPEKEDEYLTYDSVRFHEKMGYKLIGEFHKCGKKFDRWYNMVWMEKIIGEHS